MLLIATGFLQGLNLCKRQQLGARDVFWTSQIEASILDYSDTHAVIAAVVSKTVKRKINELICHPSGKQFQSMRTDVIVLYVKTIVLQSDTLDLRQFFGVY